MTGVLLLNLGSPDAPGTEEVRRYLGEFLMDPYVIDIPWLARFLLVKGVILRTRPEKSAEAYRSIWTERGSPLVFHSEDLAKKVQAELGEEFRVRSVMRYGRPSVGDAFESMVREGITSIVVLPLYPQEAGATTLSSREWVKREAKRVGYSGRLEFVPAFFSRGEFIQAFARNVRESLDGFGAERVLFSFHGLPERQIRKAERVRGSCLSSVGCCETLNERNRTCYRAQCFATAYAIAEAAGIGRERMDIAFQSRLGRTPWIRPYADERLMDYANEGIKKVLVVSPSFVADCLETLEELGIRAREDFERSGGELRLVECPNSDPVWAAGVANWVREASAGS
jgi:ferrochelatase